MTLRTGRHPGPIIQKITYAVQYIITKKVPIRIIEDSVCGENCALTRFVIGFSNKRKCSNRIVVTLYGYTDHIIYLPSI